MRLISWLIVAVLLVGGVYGIANSAYHRGVAQGAAVAAAQTPPSGEAAPGGAAPAAPAAPYAPPYPYYGAPNPYYFGPGYYRPFGFFGFLFPLAFVILALGALRLFFFRRWAWARGRGWGAGGCGPGGTGVPPMFEEWHRRAHEGTAKAESI